MLLIDYLNSVSHPVLGWFAHIPHLISQRLKGTDWGDLDVLILDLPPGTGDVQLTVCQELQLTGAVAVTTPSKLATEDTRKGIEMFTTLGVPTLAIVENMSYFMVSQLLAVKFWKADVCTRLSHRLHHSAKVVVYIIPSVVGFKLCLRRMVSLTPASSNCQYPR